MPQHEWTTTKAEVVIAGFAFREEPLTAEAAVGAVAVFYQMFRSLEDVRVRALHRFTQNLASTFDTPEPHAPIYVPLGALRKVLSERGMIAADGTEIILTHEQ